MTCHFFNRWFLWETLWETKIPHQMRVSRFCVLLAPPCRPCQIECQLVVMIARSISFLLLHKGVSSGFCKCPPKLLEFPPPKQGSGWYLRWPPKSSQRTTGCPEFTRATRGGWWLSPHVRYLLEHYHEIRPHRRCWGVIVRMALVKGYRFTWGGGGHFSAKTSCFW